MGKQETAHVLPFFILFWKLSMEKSLSEAAGKKFYQVWRISRESCSHWFPCSSLGQQQEAACVKPKNGGGASSLRPFCDLSGSQVMHAWQPYRSSWHRAPASFPGRWREETPHSPSQGQEAGVSHGILQLGQIITGHLCLFVYKHSTIQP